jgi:hypothetical protein
MKEIINPKAVYAILLAFLGVVLLNNAAFADSDTIYTKITPSHLVQLVERHGGRAVDKGQNVVIWTLGGTYAAALKISDSNENMMFLFFSSDLKLSPDQINKWNQEKAYSKAWIDDEGDTFLELDLDFAGGITEANIMAYLALCDISWKTFVSSHK